MTYLYLLLYVNELNFRRDRCQTCHHILHEIRCLLESRLKTVSDASLRQLFDDNLRLLNACERS